jgi:hypothetical protein
VVEAYAIVAISKFESRIESAFHSTCSKQRAAGNRARGSRDRAQGDSKQKQSNGETKGAIRIGGAKTTKL